MKTLFGILLLTLGLHVHAGGIEQLKAFMADTKSAKAQFTQVVTSTSGRKPQTSSGLMAIARPGKFRWTYEKPFPQLLVSDGVRLWTYDKDLAQVTIRKIGDALSGTPAALLAGDGDLDRSFTLADLGKVDGMEMVEAVPKDKTSTFQRMRLGFIDKVPQRMEVQDNFGQTTTLSFSSFERNPVLPASMFTFTPPTGVDVIGE